MLAVYQSLHESIGDGKIGKASSLGRKILICDVIKQNESELANIDFKIGPIIAVNFLCISMF